MERSTIVRVSHGLHARPATRFVKLAKSFESNVELIKQGRSANAKSSVKLMLLGVMEDDEITVRAEGADQIEAIEALIGYLENPLSGTADELPRSAPPEEAETALTESRPADKPIIVEPIDASALKGVAASEGVCLGGTFAYFPHEILPERRIVPQQDIPAEIERFRKAVLSVQQRMDRLLAAEDLLGSDRGIIAALKDIVTDDTLIEGIESEIGGGLDAVSSVIGVSKTIADEFGKLADPYLNGRADDVRAIARQLCLELLGQKDLSLKDMPQGAILIADDIGALELARAPLGHMAGIVCGKGGATSHIAIIARAHGIPAVLGLGGQVETLQNTSFVAVDGTNGYVIADPNAEVQDKFKAILEEATPWHKPSGLGQKIVDNHSH